MHVPRNCQVIRRLKPSIALGAKADWGEGNLHSEAKQQAFNVYTLTKELKQGRLRKHKKRFRLNDIIELSVGYHSRPTLAENSHFHLKNTNSECFLDYG